MTQFYIDLEQDPSDNIKLFQATTYITAIVFEIASMNKLEQSLEKILDYMPIFDQNPAIKTSIKIGDLQSNPLKRYSKVAVGGTFDHLHIGHQILLLYAGLSCQGQLLVGITGQSMLQKKKLKGLLEPFEIRSENVRKFIYSINKNIKLKIGQLKDGLGPPAYEKEFDCLVVSQQTLPGGTKINEVRKTSNLQELSIVVCPTIGKGKAIQSKISSSLIRQYLLNKNELSYEQFELYKGYYSKLIDSFLLAARKESFNEEIQKWWSSIFESYSQPWRFYHTNGHIFNLLQNWQIKRENSTLSHTQQTILIVSVFFHDFIYRPDSKDNQTESAIMSQKFLDSLLLQSEYRQNLKKQISKIILETSNHKPSNLLSYIMYDLDMGILDEQLQTYKQYAKNIKKQYYPFFKDQFNIKRIQFLRTLTPQSLHFSYEPTRVKQNIQWQIQFIQMQLTE